MKNYTTFAETEALLKTAIGLPGRSVKDIAEAENIKAKQNNRNDGQAAAAFRHFCLCKYSIGKRLVLRCRFVAVYVSKQA